MGTVILWVLHLSFCLLLLAAALAWGQGRSAVARRTALTLAVLPLLALNAWIAWRALWLRFGFEMAHAPWLGTTGLLGVHLVGVGVLLVRSRPRPGAAPWPRGVLTLCALVALALDVTTLWNLELAARLRASDLRLEAGRIAWRESPPRPRPEENAASIYLDVAGAMEGERGVDLSPWTSALQDEAALDADDPELRAALARLGPGLARVREAARLPACWLEPAPEPDGAEDLLRAPRIFPLLALANALALEARVRAADGEMKGALEDVTTLLALADHIAQTPILISVMLAGATRSLAVRALVHVLASDGLEASALEGLELGGESPLVLQLPRALTMESAWGLGAIGLLARTDWVLDQESGWAPWSRLDATLFRILMLDSDVRGYRQSLAELQAQVRLPLTEQLTIPEPNAVLLQSRGLLTAMMIPNLRSLTVGLHRFDVEVELARLALAAARYRLAHGRYPTSLDQLGVDAPGVELEGDGNWVRILRPDVADGDGPLGLRLPPRVGD